MTQAISYSKDFYNAQQGGSRRSAEVVVPKIMEILEPKSVVDIGCGVGTWLSVFKEQGVEVIKGLDGDYVNRSMLQIPQDAFQPYDLKKPLKLDRQYDLVMSLEVAEHLPQECAETFVESLTQLGRVVLFSAAIPHQGGTHHVNEQWPEYWSAMFEKRGYFVIDCLRGDIWDNPDVDWCYAQNILIYATLEAIEANSRLMDARKKTNIKQLAMVHPRKFLEQCDPDHMTLRRLLGWAPVLLLGLPKIFKNAVLRRLK